MGVLSKLLCSSALNGGPASLQAAAPLALNAARAFASGSDYTIIDHEYDAVVVGAGGALLPAVVKLLLLPK